MSISNYNSCQQEYLKKYLSGNELKKKKKKKLASSNHKRSQIIDDDIDLKSMRPLDDDEVDLYQMDEDAPQIAGIIDERPVEVKAQEYYNSKRWKVFGGDDGVSVVDNLEKHQSVSDKLSLMSKEFSEKQGDSNTSTKKDDSTSAKSKKEVADRVKSDSSESDFSLDRNPIKRKSLKPQSSGPLKKNTNDEKNNRISEKNNDLSSHSKGKKTHSTRDNYDSDVSPPRRHHDKEYKNKKSDSDASPPRRDSKRKSPTQDHKKSRYSDNTSPRRNKTKKSRYKNDYDSSPPRKIKIDDHRKRNNSDSDNSPPRGNPVDKRNKDKYDRNYDTRKEKIRRSSSSDNSPPRKERNLSQHSKSTYSRNIKRHSPPRDNHEKSSSRLSRRDLMDKNKAKRHFSDSDDSPPRRRKSDSFGSKKVFSRNSSGSDLSPPRKESLSRREKPKKALYKPQDDSSDDESKRSKSKKMKTTLDGKQAGLQDARQLKKELSDLKMKEDSVFSKMEASVSGFGAAPIKRDRKTGQVRDLEKEKEVQKEKDAKESIVKEKYYKWGKGIKQMEDAEERTKEIMKEMNKPLARYADDTDLDNFLKAQERDGDPMLDYVRKKQSESTALTGVKPVYQGAFNPNRFGIRPGHRWDGVVRSNGYEKEWFAQQNARRAINDEAYKWSTSDM